MAQRILFTPLYYPSPVTFIVAQCAWFTFLTFHLALHIFSVTVLRFVSPGGAAIAVAVNAGRKRVFSPTTEKAKADFPARHGTTG